MKKILIATSNKSKFEQMMTELSDLHFKFVSLQDLKLDKIEVEEPYDNLWENALEKAKFFAKKTKLLTIAEDTGLFIDALGGKPGVKTKRYAPTAAERNKVVLEKLKNIPDQKRTAYFETAGCVYNPDTNSFSMFFGRVNGLIHTKIDAKMKEDMGYDSVFYFPPLKKLLSELSLLDKNMISSRGKMITQVGYFLTKNHQPRQIICAAGIIVKDGKILMTKRRDMRPEFNNKWEFPGGSVENGETFIQTLHNEMLEETGFKVEVQEQMPDIVTTLVKKDAYQVHLFMCICTIKSGKIKLAPSESSDYDWFTYREALKADMLPLNKKLIQTKNNKKVLLKYIKY
jgi:XTP/dITP diphosphohydrolase